MKPDIILTWPSGIDYPLCRLQLTMFRSYFKEVLICFYPHGTPDFREFVAQSHPDFKYFQSNVSGPAWRETAVNISLTNSKSDWVLFTEQDFFWKDEKFLERVFSLSKIADVIGIRQGERLHPAFLLVRRSLIEQTTKDFSVKGLHQDHFTQFSREILDLGKFAELKEIGLFEGRDWYHLSSLTWNLFRIKDRNIREMHNLPDFLIYNTYSRTKRVKQDPRWLLFTHYAESLLSSFGKYLNE